MGNSEYFATARVKVKPDASTFAADLRRDVQRAIDRTRVFKIPVELELKAFRNKINREIRRKPFDVPIRPDVRDFRAKLLRELAGIEVPVKVVPVGAAKAAATTQAAAAGAAATGAATGTGAAGAAARLSEEERLLRDVQKARVPTQRALLSAERSYAQALSGTATVEERALALEEARTVTERGLTAAGLGATTAEVRRTAAVTAGNEAEAARQAAIQQGLLTDREALATQLQLVETTQLADRTEAKHALLKEASAKATDLAAGANARDAASLTKASEVRAFANTQLEVQQALERNVAAAKEVRIAAERLGNVEMAKEAAAIEATNVALIEQVRAERALTKAQLEGIGPAAARARTERQLAKGTAASALGMLGLRGAVLAASGPFLAGTVAAIAFGKAVGSAAELETQLNVFQATAGATADQMERVRQKAVELGADITLPAVGAGDAAAAMVELGKAGLSVEDSMDAARGVLQLATAANIDNATATQLVANALNAFGLAGTDAIRIADNLANSANLSQGSIEDVGVAFQQASAAARQAGFSMQDTSAILTLLARNGIRGSDAGTSLRTAIIRLINPTDKARAEIDRLNKALEENGEQTLRIRDAQGNIRPEIFAEMGEAAQLLGRAQGEATLAIIAGQDAFRTFSILGREGAASLAETTGSVDRVGAATELANARTKGFAGSVEALKNSLATLGISLGRLSIGPLKVLIDTANTGITAMNDFAAAIERAAEIAEAFKLPAPDFLPGFLERSEEEGDEGGGGFGRAFRRAWETTMAGFGVPTEAKEQVERDAEDVASEVAEILNTFAQGGGAGGPSATNQAIVRLRDLVKELQAGSPAAQQLARDVEQVIDQLSRGSSIPPFKIPEIELPASLKSGAVGREIAGDILTPMDIIFQGAGVRNMGQELIDNLAAGAKERAKTAGADIGADFASGISTALAVAEAQGDEAGRLALLRRKRATDVRRQAALLRGTGLSPSATAAQIQAQVDAGRISQEQAAKIRNAAIAIKKSDDEINGILDDRTRDREQAARDAEQAKNEIIQANNKHDQAVIDSFGAREAKATIRQAQIEASEKLSDDIALSTTLIGIYRSEIREARKRIRDSQTATEVIRDLTRKLNDERAKRAKLIQDQAQAAKDARQKALERQQESLELDVQIAETTGDKAALRRALNREIAFYRERIKATRAGSVERKRWILALRQAQKELEELAEEKKKERDAFRAMAFEFLTTQQGFFATVAGNLLPGFSVAGAVGGQSGPAAGPVAGPASNTVPTTGRGGLSPIDIIRKEQLGGRMPTPGGTLGAAADMQAARDRGITHIQATRMVGLMAQMVTLLSAISGRTRHPESKKSQVVNRHHEDYG